MESTEITSHNDHEHLADAAFSGFIPESCRGKVGEAFEDALRNQPGTMRRPGR